MIVRAFFVLEMDNFDAVNEGSTLLQYQSTDSPICVRHYGLTSTEELEASELAVASRCLFDVNTLTLRCVREINEFDGSVLAVSASAEPALTFANVVARPV